MPDNDPQPANPAPPPSPGRIDLHSHILPGIDDGCTTVEEALESVRVLKEHGYVGTVCTPHCWPKQYPHITPTNIAAWRDALQQEINNAGLGYTLWTGGELRIYPGAVEWMQASGIPRLAGSDYVLCDFWEKDWHPWIDDTVDWLIEQGCTPILAHPERSPTHEDYDTRIGELAERGVIFQGNLRCFTGEEGYYPDSQVRKYMDQGLYTVLALDMHRTETLRGRLDGIALAAEEYGQAKVDAMLDTEVRALLFGE